MQLSTKGHINIPNSLNFIGEDMYQFMLYLATNVSKYLLVKKCWYYGELVG